MNEGLLSQVGQRIGWTLVHSIWQFALVAGLLAVVLQIVRGFSPQLRYRLMLAALCVMAIWPIVTLFTVSPPSKPAGSPVVRTRANAPDEFSSRPTIDDLSASLPGESLPKSIPNPASIELAHDSFLAADSFSGFTIAYVRTTIADFVAQWINVIVGVWLVGVLLLSLRPLIGWNSARALRSQGRSTAPEQIVVATQRVAQRLGVRQIIEIAQSSLVEVPTLIGWLKPLVLLPASAVSGLSSAQLEAIIAHELAHVRRHDYIVNMFQLLLETVFFYHPAVWWVSQRMRVEREECCDDIAVQMTGDRVGYVKLLVWLEESRDQSNSSSLVMSSDGGSLLSRVRRLVVTPAETNGSGPLVMAVGLLFVLGITCLIASSAGNSLAQESDAPQPQRFSARVTDELSVTLLAVRPHQLAEVNAWQPDGTNFERTPELPKVRSNSATLNLNGVELVFQFDGLDKTRPPAYRMEGLNSAWPVDAQGYGCIIAKPLAKQASATVRIGIPDEQWGPWIAVNHAGQVLAPVVISPPYQQTYAAIRLRDAVSRDEHTLFRWETVDDQRDLAAIEVVAVDKQGSRHQPGGATLWDDAQGIAHPADVFDRASEMVDRFEYRLRPYRHWITFENVSLVEGNRTAVTSSVRAVDIPPAGDQVSISGRIEYPKSLDTPSRETNGSDVSPAHEKGWMYYSAKSRSGSYQGLIGQVEQTFEFKLVPGQSFVTYYAEGYAPTWSPKLNLQPGDVVQGLTLQLTPGVEATVQIQTANGEPIADAKLVAHPLIHGETGGPNFPHISNQSGQVSLKHLADTKYKFRVEAAGFETLDSGPIPIVDDSPLILTMQRAQPVTGRVINGDGTPAVGAKLRARLSATSSGASWFANEGSDSFGEVMTVTDEAGEFTLDRLSSDLRYLFIIEGADGSRLLYRDFIAGQSDLEIRLPKRFDLHIKFKGDIAGRFAPGVKPYLEVQQKFSFERAGSRADDLTQARVPIELTEDGGLAIFPGLVVDPESGLSDQSVLVRLGTQERPSQSFSLSNETVTTVQWRE